MKSLTTSNNCLQCKECCKFHKDDAWFAPVFTGQEIAAIPDMLKKGVVFQKHRLSAQVKQISLVQSKTTQDVFICPFYDEDSAKCRIYFFRPLDCKMWPVMAMRTRFSDRVHITLVKKRHCRSIRNVSEKEKLLYAKYILAFFSTKKMKSYFRIHPEVIWPWESGYDRIGTISL